MTNIGLVPIIGGIKLEPILTPIAEEILKRRYLIKDEDGVPTETPGSMFERVANTVAKAETNYANANVANDIVTATAKEFYKMMSQGYWLPNSPTLMNAGRPLGQLSACFVLPVEDALSNGRNGIYDTLTAMALIHQSGGGTGFSFSRLRPAGSIVRSTTGVASGPVSFMRLYDASTDVVKQGGTRRGANMGILRVDHPDIMEFINCKRDTSKITNFNISVAITDAFMDKVLDGDQEAGEIWANICENAWATGEPGLFFIDEANRHNPVPHLGEYEATNPCAEQPLLPYDVCNLGSLNLGKFVNDDREVDWNKMEYYVQLSTRFLDNVIDINSYPLPEIGALSKQIRRIGNGVMGFADMLIKLGIPYGSDRSIEFAGNLAKWFVETCKDASYMLAQERGPFPEWKNSKQIHDKWPLRNCNVTTIAPTGTISMIAGCSGGIEPLYAVAFRRRQANTELIDVNTDFQNMLQKHPEFNPLDYNKTLKLILDKGSVGIDGVPIELVELFQTSATVRPEDHIKMQAAWQGHICSGISKTINMPKESEVADVAKSFRMAYDLGCKGVTVYRDGSRPEQVLSTGKTDDARSRDKGTLEQPRHETEGDSRNVERPKVLNGRTHRISSPIGGMYVTVNRDNQGHPYEVFVNVGKAGGTTPSFSEALGRLISLGLRNGITVKEVHKQLRGISSDRAFGFGNGKVASGPDAVALVLEEYMEDSEANDDHIDSEEFAACPDCHSELSFSEGCYKCYACGYGGC